MQPLTTPTCPRRAGARTALGSLPIAGALCLTALAAGCGGGEDDFESSDRSVALRGVSVRIASPYMTDHARLYAYRDGDAAARLVAQSDGPSGEREFSLFLQVNDEQLPPAVRYFVVAEGAGFGGPGAGVLACIGPLADFAETTEVEITCDAGTMAAYSAAYAVAGLDDPRLYSLILQRDVAEAWLTLGVFPDAVAQPAKSTRDVIGLAALAYAAVLRYVPEVIGPARVEATTLLNEIVWESLRRLREDGVIGFADVAEIAAFELAGTVDVGSLVQDHLADLYPQVAGLVGFTRFDAENIVLGGIPVLMDVGPLMAPGELIASPRPQGAALRWRPVVGADGYRVYVDFAWVAEIRTISHTLSGLDEPRPYDIGVSAFNRFGESLETTAQVTPAEPPRPVDITATFANGAIVVTWNEGQTTNPSVRVGYVLRRDGRVIFEGSRTEFLDTDVEPGTAYVYSVVVVAGEAASEPSSVRIVTPEN